MKEVFGTGCKASGPFMRKSFVAIGLRFLLIPWVATLFTGVCVHSKESIRVAILPFQFHAKENLDYLQDAIFVTISGRLIGEETIEIVDRGAVKDALVSRETTGMVEETARDVAGGLDADYAIVGHLTKVGELVDPGITHGVLHLGSSGRRMLVSSDTVRC